MIRKAKAVWRGTGRDGGGTKRRWSEAAPMRADSDRLISVHTARGEGP